MMHPPISWIPHNHTIIQFLIQTITPIFTTMKPIIILSLITTIMYILLLSTTPTILILIPLIMDIKTFMTTVFPIPRQPVQNILFIFSFPNPPSPVFPLPSSPPCPTPPPPPSPPCPTPPSLPSHPPPSLPPLQLLSSTWFCSFC